MLSKNDIILFARNKSRFSAKELVAHFKSLGVSFSEASVRTRLRRMVADGELIKPAVGLYSTAQSLDSDFIPYFDEEMADIERRIKEKYPFLDTCVWNIRDIKSMSHYSSKADVIFVDVDRDATEGVFAHLADSSTIRRVYLCPTQRDYMLYVNQGPAIVVKPMVSQAPLLKFHGDSYHTSIEKILVDLISDTDFAPWQGYEALRFYDTAFDRFAINNSKLQRYAARRGKTEEVNKLIEDIKKIES